MIAKHSFVEGQKANSLNHTLELKLYRNVFLTLTHQPRNHSRTCIIRMMMMIHKTLKILCLALK